ncbi:MAG TPA: PAS domain-containing protein [Terricaulis sp.]|nr:PAS domain-containing protein [Terricaulis sp.]
MGQRIAVSSADFIRNIGHWQNEAMRQPISITHHGRERLVLAAAEAFHAEAAPDATAAAELTALRAASAAVLENMDEGYLAFDAHARIRGANAVAEAFIGAPRDTLIGRTVFEALPDPMAAMLADRLARVLRARRAEAFECSAFDGRHAAIRVFPAPEGAAALLHNVTEQYVLRRERETGLALDHAVRAHEGLAVVQLDAHARIETVDAAFTAWSGFAAGELRGHQLADLIAAGARRELMAAFERALREAAPMRVALTLIGKRGDEISGPAAIAPMLSDFVARGAQLVWTRAHTTELARAAS